MYTTCAETIPGVIGATKNCVISVAAFFSICSDCEALPDTRTLMTLRMRQLQLQKPGITNRRNDHDTWENPKLIFE